MVACWCGEVQHSVYLDGRFDRLGEHGRPFRVVRCAACGTKRTDPTPDDSQYRDPKRAEELSHDGSDYASHSLRLILSMRTAGRYLDLGCNQGQLVEAAAAAGFDAVGADVDPYSTRLAREHGRNVVTGSVLDVDGAFDVISMVHVAEHVVDLPELLGAVESRLAPDGRLLVVVPNHRGVVPRLMGERWMFWAPSEHVWHFDRRTLVALVERSTGLRAVQVTRRGSLEAFSATSKGTLGRVVQRIAGLVGGGEQLEAWFAPQT